MQGDNKIPDDNYVCRHCRSSDLFRDASGQPKRLLESAFRPRQQDIKDGLSVIWLEFFQGARAHNLECVRSVTKLTAKKNDRIALVQVGKLIQALQGVVPTASVEKDPIDDLPPHKNAAHALIKPPDPFQNENLRDIAASVLTGPTDIEEY